VTTLAIDTCEANCSAALLLEGGQCFSLSEELGRGHAERLLPMVEDLLAEASLVYSDISRIAVTVGPGTFTGLRIGLSVARGLALSLNVPCVGLTSLMTLAAQAPVSSGIVHAVLKGRGGQVFYQSFDRMDARGLPHASCDPVNIDEDEARRAIEETSGFVLGSAVPLVMGREIDERDKVDPITLARLAGLLDPADFLPEPFYLRAADAVKARPIFRIDEG